MWRSRRSKATRHKQIALIYYRQVNISIQLERPDSPDALALITELNDALHPDKYPPKSQHGFSVEKLIAQNVAFFVVRVDGVPAGCGGIKLFDEDYGEIKRMFVRSQWRGRGLARRTLGALEDHAVRQGVKLVRLETGIYQQDAIRLYEGAGYREIGPFGEYGLDPLSLYYEKTVGQL